MKFLIIVLFVFAFFSCENQSELKRQKLDLSGTWQFSLDTGNVGIQEKWYLSDFSDSVTLPGTSDINQKGFLNKDTTTGHLNRLYRYEGAAWYRKIIEIPESFTDKHIELILERTKSSYVWIDDIFIGKSHLLQSPQHYDISGYLSPGKHSVTIRIDNSLELTPYGNVHIISDDTQTNWNGIIGKIFIEASAKTYISDLQVYPDFENKKINVKLQLENGLKLSDINVKLNVVRCDGNKVKKLKEITFNAKADTVINLEYILGNGSQLWDDYNQPLYYLTAIVFSDEFSDEKTVSFGMRKFAVNEKQFTINGRTTFLRGKQDACVFPLTGHVPMDTGEWKRVFRIAKSYGLNHYRFHSYCPPEAAFIAADEEGIYLQPELPFWGGLNSDSVAEMLKAEGFAMLKHYSNHPSFVMFSHGNEIWGGHERVEKNLAAFKQYDGRPLYTMGSNNGIGYVEPTESSDFFVGARTPFRNDTILTHVRLTHAFCDSRDGGILNTEIPSTMVKFSYPVSQLNMPVISHEVGQYQTFPDYDEIEKYTGVLKPWNLEVFRNRLNKAGMMDQNKDFQKASGIWAAICYKAEMEAALRTDSFAGFQLLDLQDFSGQGTALVGILDAFMDSKNTITPEEWLQSCNDVVLLLEFQKYCWNYNEVFKAKIKVANYSNKVILDDLICEIIDNEENIIKKETFQKLSIKNGKLNSIGEIEIPLSFVKKAEKLKINIFLKTGKYSNSYPIWVYPENKNEDINEIIIADQLNANVLQTLNEGKKVLLFPSSQNLKDKFIPGLFPPEFWNYGMFKSISERAGKPVSPGTMGILTNPQHPLFENFPADYHTNWQWFSIIKNGGSLILDKTSNDYRPVVQVIDNLERNHKLGLIFEFKVGTGKLLVCMSDLRKIKDKPEAAQLYYSIIKYMKSDDFNPQYVANKELLKELL